MSLHKFCFVEVSLLVFFGLKKIYSKKMVQMSVQKNVENVSAETAFGRYFSSGIFR